MQGIEPSWLLAGLVALHLLTLCYALWRRAGESPERGGGSAEVLDTDVTGADVSKAEFGAETETVVCTHCGAENDAEYAFCRGCANELPGGPTGQGGPNGAFGSGSI